MPRVTQQQRTLIVALYRTGTPVDDVALSTGVSRATVYGALKAAGVPLKERGMMSPETRRMILELSRQGSDERSIARQVGLSTSVVRDILKRDALAAGVN